MVMSAPVTFAVRSLARMSTRSATSSGRLNRPVTIWCAAWLWTSSGLAPVARLTVAATPGLAEPQVGADQARAYRVYPDAVRADLLG